MINYNRLYSLYRRVTIYTFDLKKSCFSLLIELQDLKLKHDLNRFRQLYHTWSRRALFHV